MHKTYEENLDAVDRVVDRLGTHIDEPIKPLIAVLWTHGIYTVGSCAGHDDDGRKSYPYVFISAEDDMIRPPAPVPPEVQQVGDKLHALAKDMKEEGLLLATSVASLADDEVSYIIQTKAEYVTIDARSPSIAGSDEDRIQEANRKALEKLSMLLNDFYANRIVPHTQVISIQKFGSFGAVKLECNGTALAELEHASTKQFLYLVREEMQAFGDFLKDRV